MNFESLCETFKNQGKYSVKKLPANLFFLYHNKFLCYYSLLSEDIMLKIKFYTVITILLFPLLLHAGIERIVSISPLQTESIYLLGAEDKLVGNTTYCIRPEAAKSITKIGDLVNISVEKIISLRPDLVLTTKMTRRESIEKLISLGIRVEVFDQANEYDEICKHFLRLADLLDKRALAEKIVSKSREDVRDILKSSGSFKKYRVFVQIGASPLFTVNKDSFIHDYITMSGGINIAAEARSGIYNREEVLYADPDVVIITDMGIDTLNEIKIWEKYRHLNAVKNNRIYTIETYIVCSPNPVTYVTALKEFIRLIQGENSPEGKKDE